jgi:hypothetical protein
MAPTQAPAAKLSHNTVERSTGTQRHAPFAVNRWPPLPLLLDSAGGDPLDSGWRWGSALWAAAAVSSSRAARASLEEMGAWVPAQSPATPGPVNATGGGGGQGRRGGDGVVGGVKMCVCVCV